MVHTEETTVETEIETTDTTTTNVENEALKAQNLELEEKNKALGDKIYKLKKENKSTETPETWLSRDEMETFYQEKKFFETNPTMLEHKDEIDKFTSKGYSLKHAMSAVIENNPDIAARQNTQNSNFTTWTPDFSKTEFSKADLEAMNQFDYNKVMDLQEKGKVKII